MDSENLFLWQLYLICFQQINTEFKLIDWTASWLAVTQSASSRLLCKLNFRIYLILIVTQCIDDVGNEFYCNGVKG